MNKYILSLLIVSCFLQFGHTQRRKAFIEAADSAFTIEKDYYKAFKYYEAVAAPDHYRDTSDILRILYQKAESARRINAYEDARDAYLELLARAPEEVLTKSPYGSIWAYLGQVEIGMAYAANQPLDPADYEQAAKYFEAYSSRPAQSKTEHSEQTARNGLAVIEFVNNIAEQDRIRQANESVDLRRSPKDTVNAGFVNSKFSDLAATPRGDRLYFSSNRTSIREKGIKPERYFSRIYQSADGVQADTLQNMNLTPKDRVLVEHPTFNRDSSKLYFTRCAYVGKSLETRCELYYQRLDGNKIPMDAAVPLSGLNDQFEGFTVTQPAIAWEAAEEKEVLYFVSDRAEAKGGMDRNMDIWKIDLKADGEPVNASPTNLSINTAGDEVTPFYQDGVLYFSSNGYPNRYGGLDIFSFRERGESPAVVNLGQKINSSVDDLYYKRNKRGNEAYFSSNRENCCLEDNYQTNKNSEPAVWESCCLDIFSYEISNEPCDLLVSTYCVCPGDYSKNALINEEGEIQLQDITESGQTEGKRLTYNGEAYTMDDALYPGRRYRITGEVPGWKGLDQGMDFTYSNELCTDGVKQAQLNLECTRPSLIVNVYHNDQLIPNAKVWITAINKNEGSESPCPLASNIMNEEGGITAGTPQVVDFDREYMIIAAAGPYNRENDAGLVPFDTSYTLLRTDENLCNCCEKVIDISLKSPDLPNVEVFFHNDEPKWPGGSWDSPNGAVSSQPYLATLQDYQGISDDYLTQFNSENDAEQKFELESFFTNELIPSEQNLIDFAQKATELLCKGIPVTVEANGCYSPKFTATQRQIRYNQQLIKRRKESVEQDLKKLGLTKERWGNLYQFDAEINRDCTRPSRVTNVSQQELQDQENEKFSVFSIDAAVARRVELELKIR